MTGGIIAAGFGLWGEEAALKMGIPGKAIDRHESFAVTTLITFGLLLIYHWRIRARYGAGVQKAATGSPVSPAAPPSADHPKKD